jgi:oligopeptide/dipeptide ABC transporter ATP-binding protein
MTTPLLAVRDLSKWFPVRRSLRDRARSLPPQRLVAVDRVSLELASRETLGIVGESGSGKTTLARCLVRLHEPSDGSIVFDGADVRAASPDELRTVRRRMQMVFQDPYTSLNPRLTVASAILEAGRVHGRATKGNGEAFVGELLAMVGLSQRLAGRRPRELSGGQRQRVAIARALAVGPDVLIGDEAVSSLDVSVQAQILNLFEELRRRLDLTMIFISHQLSVVSHISDRVAIMYLGRIVEQGPTAEVFRNPQHPYTKGLLDANPTPDPAFKRGQPAIRGELPSPLAIPTGCRFRTRCPFAEARCAEVDPPLDSVGPAHLAACHVLPFRGPRSTRPATTTEE